MAKTLAYEELKEMVEKRIAYFKRQAESHYSIAKKIEIETGADDSWAEGNYLAAEDYEDLANDFRDALDVMHNANVYGNCKRFTISRKSGPPKTKYSFWAFNYDGKVVHSIDVTTYLP